MVSWAAIVWTLTLVGVSQCYIDKTVLQYLIDNGYSEFVKLLRETKQDTLLSGKGPVTVFAPSNTAINQLSPDINSTLNRYPVQKENLVKYHLANEELLIPALANFHHIPTNAGQNIDMVLFGQSMILNNDTRVAHSPNNDIVCNNGVVQPIDKVLIPPLYSGSNLAEKLVTTNMFEEFLVGLLLTNLTDIIEKGEFTLFAPINAAFAEHLNNILHPRVDRDRRRYAYNEMIKYHLVPGARDAGSLKMGQRLYTLHGTPINITVLTSGIVLNNAAHIVQTDIPAANGIIHAIDHLLFPGDVLEKLRKEYWAAHPTTTQPSG